ncbi:cyanophycin synthetase [Clostridium intestinale]|uniref:cyanophycin synthetase n=1 Tax=Clostridium intestinale TaxID=36845 RepID=UPI002DD689D4|nr:cyanophycin synthetase [Clostridium intestinale]WRY49904.1 cyanophycin synthetase [Clostridium intestinale]
MKIVSQRVYDGKNIYSHKKCIRMDLDLEGYCEIPSKDIPNFNFNLLKILPELYKHRCGIDEDSGFVKRLNEGTYLAHICEHCIIAIQNMLNIDVAYGKAREVKDDHYYIIFQYQYKNVALECAKLAIDLINSLINQVPIKFSERFDLIKNMIKDEAEGPSTKAICDYARKIGLPVVKLGESGMYQIGYGSAGRIIEATIGSNTSCVATDIACDKLLTKTLLKYQYIPVANGYKVNNIMQLINYSKELKYPLVLKPQYGSKGKGVVLNINDDKELINAFKRLKEQTEDILLEKYICGKDYRVLIVDGKVIAASLRVPPFIEGDGKRSVRELIYNANKDPNRGEDHEKPLTKIKIDEQLLSLLIKENLTLNSIIEKSKRLYLRENANLSTGGYAIDCTDIICEENKDIAIRAANAVGLDICGVDICTEDISKPLGDIGIVMEVNAAPGIRMHCYPTEGKAVDVAKPIVNLLYNDNPKNIPVISVTGTNGKTTTTRLISYIFNLIGYKVGMTSTDGIFVGDKCIDTGDDTGAESAKTIFLNKDVEVAVLETARGGIIRKGLAYDFADVGIITNITEDHLGLDGINSMEELMFVKSLVVEEIREGGYAVINADDYWSLQALSRIKSKKVFFSFDKDNRYIMENISNGGIAIYLDENNLMVTNNNKTYKICAIDKIGISLDGKLKYNIGNAMAAVGALVAMNVDYCIIAKGLESFKSDEKTNRGRFNQFEINGVNVILDYGHNYQGYKSVISSLVDMKVKNLIGVIGVPGDREDGSSIKIAELCGEHFDKVFIKEDKDKRGRKEREVAEILERGVLKTIKEKNNVKVVLDELEALREALNIAQKGDLIVVFYEKFDRLFNYLKSSQGVLKEVAVQ